MLSKCNSTKQLKKNVSLSIVAQLVSFSVSLLLNLLLPKFVPEKDYSYWQTFLLYASYVPLLHFGFLDGLMLRYSQYDYDSLDKSLIGSQFKLFLFVEMLFAGIGMVVSVFIEDEIGRCIWRFISIAIITTNVFTYTSYLFQLTNRIGKYAVLIIVERALLGIGIVALLLLGVSRFYWICGTYLLATFCAICWGALQNRGLYFGGLVRDGILEFKENVFSGVMLLVANLSSMFLVGGAKMVVQWHYDVLTFGKVAFSFNIVNLFLTFVTAASVAIFPSIKRINNDDLPDFYIRIRRSVSPFLLLTMALYFPGCYLLHLWLPNYAESLGYLGILMPMVLYASRVTLLTNNYLKAYRKEKLMLCINVVSVAVAFIVFLISAYLLNSLLLVLTALVVVVILRSVVSEIVVMRLIQRCVYASFVWELLLVAIFVVISMKFNGFVLI
ncbi:MAG: hypothetical protein IKO21_09130 [Fibrobacter sp.]|nr:hypothetical protein [Fibrobacter sp.]